MTKYTQPDLVEKYGKSKRCYACGSETLYATYKCNDTEHVIGTVCMASTCGEVWLNGGVSWDDVPIV